MTCVDDEDRGTETWRCKGNQEWERVGGQVKCKNEIEAPIPVVYPTDPDHHLEHHDEHHDDHDDDHDDEPGKPDYIDDVPGDDDESNAVLNFAALSLVTITATLLL